MSEWIGANFGTNITVLILAAIVILIVRGMIKSRRSGKTGCSAGCAGCPMKRSCHR